MFIDYTCVQDISHRIRIFYALPGGVDIRANDTAADSKDKNIRHRGHKKRNADVQKSRKEKTVKIRSTGLNPELAIHQNLK